MGKYHFEQVNKDLTILVLIRGNLNTASYYLIVLLKLQLTPFAETGSGKKQCPASQLRVKGQSGTRFLFLIGLLCLEDDVWLKAGYNDNESNEHTFNTLV